MPDLVSAADVADFPGAPFPDAVLKAAGETVRGICGWHIAPRLTETLTLDAQGGQYLFLPTLYLVEVSEVRDLTGDTPQPITGWRKSRVGMLFRRQGWPCGLESVEVDLVHGYETCPVDLIPEIVKAAGAVSRSRDIRQESAGGMSVTYATDDPSAGMSPVLARYRIPVV